MKDALPQQSITFQLLKITTHGIKRMRATASQGIAASWRWRALTAVAVVSGALALAAMAQLQQGTTILERGWTAPGDSPRESSQPSPPPRSHCEVIADPTVRRPRVLVTDILFPTPLSAWRLNELTAWMGEVDLDILVTRRADGFSADWEPIQESHCLADYNVFVFTEAHRGSVEGINSLANGTFDTSPFLGHWPAEYLLRPRKFGTSSPSLKDYDWVHHIFLNAYEFFNKALPGYPQRQQSIHLYPGGRFFIDQEYTLPPEVTLFTTQSFVRDHADKCFPKNPKVDVFGGPMLAKDAVKARKWLHEPGARISTCFTSLGDRREKGADLYVRIAELYRSTYPQDNVTFYGIGNVIPAVDMVVFDPMPQQQLDAFYRDEVDIIFNLERTQYRNGWPLGLEGLLMGLVLFTTDAYNLNDRNGFNFGSEVTIVTEGREDLTVEAIHRYTLNRHLLLEHSMRGQDRAWEMFGHDRQMGVIISEVGRRIKATSELRAE